MVQQAEPKMGLKRCPSDHLLTLFSKGAETEMKPHALFCQMDVLRPYENDVVWKEVARWVKFEEVFEEGGKHWSKPHVSSFLMVAFAELKETLRTGALFLDMEAQRMSEIVDKVLRKWIADGSLSTRLRNHVKHKLLKNHKYQLERGLSRHGHHSQAAFSSSVSLEDKDAPQQNANLPNVKFMRKMPEEAEVVNIMVGEVKSLSSQISAFVRLKEPLYLGDMTEVAKPTRFLFFLLSPKDQEDECFQIGRCMGTLMTDEVFREVAYLSTDLDHLLSGIEEFVNQGTVLPPGSWDPTSRIEPPEEVPTLDFRKVHPNPMMVEFEEEESHVDPTLQRTGRLFGGLIEDIKRKIKWYGSDFTDAFHMQCLASLIYLFLATLAPNVTFGGLLGEATDQYMGTMECILAAAITGVAFALFSGQPLNILGTTGPMLVLEMIIFNLCKDNKWDYLPIRVWVGLWTTLLILIVVAFDLSALVRYITRFTEESFACLIALIFIYEAFAKVFGIGHEAPVHFHPFSVRPPPSQCYCEFSNSTNATVPGYNTTYSFAQHLVPLRMNEVRNSSANESDFVFTINKTFCLENAGAVVGDGCREIDFVPDVFFVSVLLFIGTFTMAMVLVKFRHSDFFPTIIRQTVSDFGVLIAIVVMVGVDVAMGLPTPKLNVPAEFSPTNPNRGWFINPISDKNPWWLILLAVIPALLATILMFMDQQITAVIVNRKDHKLKKGSGYHLDMMVLAVLTAVLSLLGLPWYVAATVAALAHVMSLKKQSECTAPGEKPTFLGVREQRVTALLVGILSGLAVLITSVLKYIPMAVLYGVFLYMGVAALEGMQLVQRVMLFMTPQKYQPDYPYLRHVPLHRVHIYTVIQVICLACLWVVKSIKSISIIFPLLVLAICFVRKGLERVFTPHELRWLDVILPGSKPTKSTEFDLMETNYDRSMSVISSGGFRDSVISLGGKPIRKSIVSQRFSDITRPVVIGTDMDGKAQVGPCVYTRQLSHPSRLENYRAGRKSSLHTILAPPVGLWFDVEGEEIPRFTGTVADDVVEEEEESETRSNEGTKEESGQKEKAEVTKEEEEEEMTEEQEKSKKSYKF